MTENIYLEEPNQLEFEACIKKIEKDTKSVVLDRTLFYATGGGQPCDLGTLKIGNEVYQVLDVNRINGEVFHLLDRAPPEGSINVIGVIDVKRRMLHSCVHTALHILNGVVFNKLGGALVTGGQVNSD